MDVLYLLGRGSLWNNRELRYSLRSLEKFGKGVDRVFVTGENPGFLSPRVIFNKLDDPGCASYNHVHKVLWTIRNTDISENFILNYDDNFLIKPVDLEKQPYYYKGELPAKSRTQRQYSFSLVNTHEALTKYGKKTRNFSVHCPVIYNRRDFLALTDPFWELARVIQHGFAVRSLYCNMLGIEGELGEDCKIRDCQGMSHVFDMIKGLDVFSVSDQAIAHGVGEALLQLFPSPCEYEIRKN